MLRRCVVWMTDSFSADLIVEQLMYCRFTGLRDARSGEVTARKTGGYVGETKRVSSFRTLVYHRLDFGDVW